MSDRSSLIRRRLVVGSPGGQPGGVDKRARSAALGPQKEGYEEQIAPEA